MYLLCGRYDEPMANEAMNRAIKEMRRCLMPFRVCAFGRSAPDLQSPPTTHTSAILRNWSGKLLEGETVNDLD